MNKVLTILVVIIIGVTSIGIIDGFSAGLMTSTETTSQTFTDYEGVLDTFSLSQQDSTFDSTGDVRDICINPDETLLAVTYQAGDLSIYEWNALTEQYEDTSFTAPASEVFHSCAFSPDGSIFMLSSPTAVYVYDVDGNNDLSASSDTAPIFNHEAKQMEFISNTEVVVSLLGEPTAFWVKELIGTSWNNDAYYYASASSGYALDTFTNESGDEFVAVGMNGDDHLVIYKNGVKLTLSSKPTQNALCVGFSPDGSMIATSETDNLFVYEFSGSDTTSSMTITTQHSIGECYDLVWITNELFVIAGGGGSTTYEYDSGSWDIVSTGDIDGATTDLVHAVSKNLIFADSSTNVQAYDVTITATGEPVTLDNTPSAVNSVTHGGNSKFYSITGADLTPTNPELLGDLIVNYDYTVTGDYPLLSIVPIVFVVVIILFVGSFIIFKNE